MLMIVIANPIQFTKVMAVPFNSEGTALATKFENCGESAVTAIPQKHHPIKNNSDGSRNNNGERRQRDPEIVKANVATLRLPTF